MGNEILTVKMNELEQKINELYSRIRRCEDAGRGEIRAVLEAQRRECAETERNLQNRMRFSKSEMVQALSGVYDRVEELLGGLRKSVYGSSGVLAGGGSPEQYAEEKILVAEYALDFAMQACEQALLEALEAMDAELAWEEKKESEGIVP